MTTMEITKKDILTMEAGPLMDALLAERVMGWTAHPVDDTGESAWMTSVREFPDPQWTGYISGHIYGFSGELHWRSEDGGVVAASGIPGKIWNPSKSVAAAWNVIEEMKRRDFWWSSSYKTGIFRDDLNHPGYEVVFRCVRAGIRGDHYAAAEEFPLAVCHAALLAMIESET